MKNNLIKGQLVKWNDDRGFGFIKPDETEKEVFLHISAIKTIGRRPKIGDVVFYELGAGKDGKTCANSVSIQGVSSLTSSINKNKSVVTNQKNSSSILAKLLAGVGIIIAIGSVYSRFNANRFSNLATTTTTVSKSVAEQNCNVKGNISVSSGQKFYHVAGMEDYEGTIIDPLKGEKWFCSESEAIAAGWRRAPR
jgi:cold shock CspA family protein